MTGDRQTYNIAPTRPGCQGLSPWYKEQKACQGRGAGVPEEADQVN